MDSLVASIQATVTSQLFVSVHVMLIVVHVMLLTVAYLIYLERKISAYIQDRLGPNRVGFDFGIPQLAFLKGKLGLGQPLADGLKFLLKEDYAPAGVDRVLFSLAPIMIIVPALIGFMVIPWGGMWAMGGPWDLPLVGTIGGETVHVVGAHVHVGVIYILAVASVGVYGVTLGGWASNSKYSFIGGLRATAQMISYEIPMGLALLAVLLLTGAVMPEAIIGYQVDNGWLIIAQPLACVIFFMCILAEANRAPFDNAEAEQELVGGYHTEYSSMRFALFFLAEYSHMITGSALFALLFLGGYHLPFVSLTSPEATSLLAVGVKFVVFFGKVVLLICFQMVIRWTLPRLRYDQVMMLGWQTLIPIALAIVVVTSIMVHLGFTGTPAMVIANIVLIVIVLVLQPVMRAWLGNPTINRRIPMYGSRFNPVPGQSVETRPSDPMALEDRPVQGTSPMVQ
ncbi:MAG: NADH-quinone oxidoreductase subunit H [Phycisphaeraceae bacterium]|nr:NADH-quinone oxidoreductase subunit H [Phycisphaeraceae bacterium]MCW5763805.1 NADH-quinone oxidoreductase subunit H [Phycisphaeraceae bacterium]